MTPHTDHQMTEPDAPFDGIDADEIIAAMRDEIERLNAERRSRESWGYHRKGNAYARDR